MHGRVNLASGLVEFNINTYREYSLSVKLRRHCLASQVNSPEVRLVWRAQYFRVGSELVQQLDSKLSACRCSDQCSDLNAV